MKLVEFIANDRDGNATIVCIPLCSIIALYADRVDSKDCIVEYSLPERRRKTRHLLVAEPYKTIVTRLGVQTAPDAMSIFELNSHE